MNALVRKEIRLIAPAWGAAMLLAVFPVWFLWPFEFSLYVVAQPPGMVVYAPFALGALLLGLSSFAQELNFGTFSMLLAQPIPRRQLWRVKTTVLAVALGLVLVALWVSLYVRAGSAVEALKNSDLQRALNRPVAAREVLSIIGGIRANILIESLLIGCACTFAAFSSGLWTNLLFRNTSAAFWFSLLIPLGLGLVAGKLFGPLPQEMGALILMIFYSAAGYYWSKKYFLRVQDTQWTGGLVSLPALLGSKTAASDHLAVRTHKPFRALVRKEIQSHQVNLFIAGLLLLTHVAVILVRLIWMGYFDTHRSAGMIWESWPLIWLAMPVLIGGAAVAEERKLGTLENFLCLPTTRRREFAVKFFTVLFFGILLGGVVPLLVEWAGTLIGLPRNVFDVSMSFNWKLVSLASELMFGAAGLAAVAFFASTLTRNLLQAIGLAMVLSLFSVFILTLTVSIGSGQIFGEGLYWLWRGPLIGVIGWPVTVGTVIALAFKNFKELNPGAKIWWRNLRTIFLALFLTALSTSVIYHRVWEMWLPEEPYHQGWYAHAFWNADKGLYSARPVQMESCFWRQAVVLPHGRLWLRQSKVVTNQLLEFEGRYFESARTGGPLKSGFVERNQWREVAVSVAGTFAIQTNGSLWDLTDLEPGINSSTTQMRRVGEETGWEKISGSPSFNHFVGLKSDGSLWEWGTTFVQSNKRSLPRNIVSPVRVGSDADWIAISDAANSSVAMKADGSLWRWGRVAMVRTNNAWIGDFSDVPRRWLSFPQQKPVAISYDGNTVAAVCQDGSLWVGGELRQNFGAPDLIAVAHGQMVRIGAGQHWQEAKWNWNQELVARSVNRLWKWNAYEMRWSNDEPTSPPVLQSKYFDWIAIGSSGNGFYALSGDGKLCQWGSDCSSYYPDSRNFLMPTRIKARTVASLLK